MTLSKKTVYVNVYAVEEGYDFRELLESCETTEDQAEAEADRLEEEWEYEREDGGSVPIEKVLEIYIESEPGKSEAW